MSLSASIHSGKFSFVSFIVIKYKIKLGQVLENVQSKIWTNFRVCAFKMRLLSLTTVEDIKNNFNITIHSKGLNIS